MGNTSRISYKDVPVDGFSPHLRRGQRLGDIWSGVMTVVILVQRPRSRWKEYLLAAIFEVFLQGRALGVVSRMGAGTICTRGGELSHLGTFARVMLPCVCHSAQRITVIC